MFSRKIINCTILFILMIPLASSALNSAKITEEIVNKLGTAASYVNEYRDPESIKLHAEYLYKSMLLETMETKAYWATFFGGEDGLAPPGTVTLNFVELVFIGSLAEFAYKKVVPLSLARDEWIMKMSSMKWRIKDFRMSIKAQTLANKSLKSSYENMAIKGRRTSEIGKWKKQLKEQVDELARIQKKGGTFFKAVGRVPRRLGSVVKWAIPVAAAATVLSIGKDSYEIIFSSEAELQEYRKSLKDDVEMLEATLFGEQ